MHPSSTWVEGRKCKMQEPAKGSMWIPSATSMSFLRLFSVIRKYLPSAYMNTLEHLYAQYMVGKFGKETIIRNVRMIVGDKLLIVAIQSIWGQTKCTQIINRVEHDPHPILGSDRSNLENESNTSTNKKDHMEVFNGVDSVPHSLLACYIWTINSFHQWIKPLKLGDNPHLANVPQQAYFMFLAIVEHIIVVHRMVLVFILLQKIASTSMVHFWILTNMVNNAYIAIEMTPHLPSVAV